MTRALLGLAAAYLLGSIPSAYIAGRLLKGIDLRQHGSGNLGATNVLRTLGALAAVVVLLADAGKGALAVLWLPRALGATPPSTWAMLYGVAAILGHIRPVFLLWKGGGKGVATAAGVFAALAPLPLAIAFAVFAVVLAATRLMSLGSLSGAVALPLAVVFLHGPRDPLVPIALAVAAFVFWTHRANIGRLRRGVEPRLGDKTLAR
jgi:acyl phosphate:glycerol-3-phosphate acyltransferase